MGSTAWSYTFRSDNARTGRCSTSIVLPIKKVDSVTTRGPIISSPIVVNDTVYVGCRDSSVYAFYKKTKVWEFKTRNWIDAAPAYKDGKLYVGSRDGLLYILDAQTGDSLNIIVNNNEQSSSPLLYDSLIVFGRGGWNKNINAYNINTTRYKWFRTNIQMVYSSAALKDSILCYGENSGSVVALNAHTGSFLWKYQTQGGCYLSTPSIENNVVWFSPGGYDIDIYALSLTTGKLLWKTRSNTESLTQSIDPAFIRKLLRFKPQTRKKIVQKYLKNRSLNRSQMDYFESLTSGNRSARSFIPYGGLATSSIAVGEKNVFVVHMEYGHPKPRFTLSAFDKNSGLEQWSYSEIRSCIQLGVCSSPIVIDSLVFVGWGEGILYAFHSRKGGEPLMKDSLNGDIISSPVASKGKVFAATTAGVLYSYITTGYMENDFKNSTYCYPNPARGTVSHIQVYVLKPALMKMTLYNFANKPVLSISRNITGAFTYDWNLLSVANGVYFAHIQVKYNDGTKEKKLVKVAVLR
jgi:outer membrane protein assembly factor BamB